MRTPRVRVALASMAFTLLASILAAQTVASDRPLPDAPSASLVSPAQSAETLYRPLAPHQKLHTFAHHTISPYTCLGAAYDATWAQAWGDPSDYGGGMEGGESGWEQQRQGRKRAAFSGRSCFPPSCTRTRVTFPCTTGRYSTGGYTA